MSGGFVAPLPPSGKRMKCHVIAGTKLAYRRLGAERPFAPVLSFTPANLFSRTGIPAGDLILLAAGTR
jgi:hypothetical protein